MLLDFDSRRTREIEWYRQNSGIESYARIKIIEMRIDQDLISALTQFEAWMATDNNGNQYNAREWASKGIVPRDIDWQRQEGEGVYEVENPNEEKSFFVSIKTSKETDGLYLLSAYEDLEGTNHLGSVAFYYDKEAIHRSLTTPDVTADQLKAIAAYFPRETFPKCTLESLITSDHTYGYWNLNSPELPLGMYTQEEYAELRNAQTLNKIRPRISNYDSVNAANLFISLIIKNSLFLSGKHIPNT